MKMCLNISISTDLNTKNEKIFPQFNTKKIKKLPLSIYFFISYQFLFSFSFSFSGFEVGWDGMEWNGMGWDGMG